MDSNFIIWTFTNLMQINKCYSSAKKFFITWTNVFCYRNELTYACTVGSAHTLSKDLLQISLWSRLWNRFECVCGFTFLPSIPHSKIESCESNKLTDHKIPNRKKPQRQMNATPMKYEFKMMERTALIDQDILRFWAEIFKLK